MPVVKAEIQRLCSLVGKDRQTVIERIPYIGLDIEELTEQYIRVEYSPNRPDFGTDYGIARALRGILDVETGLPRYRVYKSNFTVRVDSKLRNVRPYICCAVVEDINLSEEDIRQLISLQEDLHQGLGRKRKVVAIGMHDISQLSHVIYYKAVSGDYSFVPLGYSKEMSVSEILEETEQGKEYGGIIKQSDYYPVLADSRGTTLSMPPIINGSYTRVTTETKKIFIDVTSTEKEAGKKALNIIVTTLGEMGCKIRSVKVQYKSGADLTPDLRPLTQRIDYNIIRQITGLKLSKEELSHYLARCRLELRGNKALIPCYRIDIMHPVDIAEEVALGYGIDKFEAVYPEARQAGEYNKFEYFLDKLSYFLASCGLLEIMSYELLDRKTLLENFARKESLISVSNPKSLEHSLLRDSLIPSLLLILSRNTKEEYPQRIFEIGRVFRLRDGAVDEGWNACVMISHSRASFSEARSYLSSLFETFLGIGLRTEEATHWAFSEGRTARIVSNGLELGFIGEVRPDVLERFGIYNLVSGFEVDVSAVAKALRMF